MSKKNQKKILKSPHDQLVDACHQALALPEPNWQIESLEPRIMKSATWVDADTTETIADATSGDDIFYGTNSDESA